ncbi:MAG: hypothetical protein ACRYGG_07370, partial [Janthinobacterium lividum]
RKTKTSSDPLLIKASSSPIDLVVISHEFTDHCHRVLKLGMQYSNDIELTSYQATLLEIDCRVPVIAAEKAFSLVRSWEHFENVVNIPSFSADNADWRRTSIDPLPRWLGISRMVSAGSNALYYHSALLLVFEQSRLGTMSDNATAEAIIYSGHGIEANDLQHLSKAQPPIRTVALLHGLHDIAMTKSFQLNLGAHNGLKAQRICKARYWVSTHDEVKRGGGLVSPFLRRSVLTVQEAMDKELAENGHIPSSSELAGLQDVNFADLASGESLLLL